MISCYVHGLYFYIQGTFIEPFMVRVFLELVNPASIDPSLCFPSFKCGAWRGCRRYAWGVVSVCFVGGR